MKRPDERLRDLAELFKDRNKAYGNNYKSFGFVMANLFPNGITLSSPDDFNRFAIFCHIADKVTRYANNYNNGGHSDSLNDMSVYAQMLQEVDELHGEIDERPRDAVHIR